MPPNIRLSVALGRCRRERAVRHRPRDPTDLDRTRDRRACPGPAGHRARRRGARPCSSRCLERARPHIAVVASRPPVGVLDHLALERRRRPSLRIVHLAAIDAYEAPAARAPPRLRRVAAWLDRPRRAAWPPRAAGPARATRAGRTRSRSGTGSSWTSSRTSFGGTGGPSTCGPRSSACSRCSPRIRAGPTPAGELLDRGVGADARRRPADRRRPCPLAAGEDRARARRAPSTSSRCAASATGWIRPIAWTSWTADGGGAADALTAVNRR